MKLLVLVMKLLVLAVACVSVTGSVIAAQPATEEPFVPWVGCWHLLQEGVRDEIPSPWAAIDSAVSLGQAPSGGTDGIRVCVTPAGAAGAFTLTTMVEEAVLLEETIVAHGAVHPVEEPGCTGQRQTEWSADGQRLFMRTAMACAGEPRRMVSGVSLMMPGPTWLDIQAVDVDGRAHVRVRRYGRAWDEAPAALTVSPELLGRAASAARVAATARLDIADVVEASAKTSPRAVEAMLAETRATFDLTRDALVALDDAAVADSVIDLMVALAYPEKFVVERPSARAAESLAAPRFPPWMDAAFGPVFDPLLYPYWFADMYPLAYAPFGYSYWWGRYDPYFLWGPTAVIGPEPGEDTAGFAEGRAVDNRGYTRVIPRDGSSELGYAHRRGQPSGDGATSAGGPSGGGSSGGAVSPQGYSSGGSGGGSGGDTGRTAEPRQP